MATQTASKPIDLVQLQAELGAAGINFHHLGSTGGDLDTNASKEIYGFNAAGVRADLPTGAAAVITAHTAGTATVRAAVLATAASAVGVAYDALTAAQVRALAGILLHKEGALNPNGTVRPLAQWVR